MTPEPDSPAHANIDTIVATYLAALDTYAPGIVEGVYLVGSFALGDWQPGRSDLDIVAVTAEPATDDDAEAIAEVHRQLAHLSDPHLVPGAATFPDIDGPYVAWGDLVVPAATGLHRPWTLHGELHHDSECFEINPVTWYTLATYGVTVRGPHLGVGRPGAQHDLDVVVDIEGMIRFVTDNLRSYWIGVANDVRRLDAGHTLTPAAFEWIALGALRLHYTAFTGDVVSKSGAARYGLQVAPDTLHPCIAAALAVRQGDDVPADGHMVQAAADVIEWCVADVTAAIT